MHHLATDASPSGGGTIKDLRQPTTDGAGRIAALVEARGIVRDVLASVRNLEHLLRSPRVGARAIAQVIPGLQSSCDPLAMSVDQILKQVRGMTAEPVDAAAAELESFTPGVVERLRQALNLRSRGTIDAKGRLAFEQAIALAGAELNSVRLLLDLLVRATERSYTDLSIQEVVHETFLVSFRPAPRRSPITVIASYEADGSDFRGSPQVVMPLISIGIAVARGASDEPVYLHAVCRSDEAVQFVLSHEGPAGAEQYSFDPPMLVPPTLVCAQTAARLAEGSFVAETDRVVLTLPR
jgi:hypothetical protein